MAILLLVHVALFLCSAAMWREGGEHFVQLYHARELKFVHLTESKRKFS